MRALNPMHPDEEKIILWIRNNIIDKLPKDCYWKTWEAHWEGESGSMVKLTLVVMDQGEFKPEVEYLGYVFKNKGHDFNRLMHLVTNVYVRGLLN